MPMSSDNLVHEDFWKYVFRSAISIEQFTKLISIHFCRPCQPRRRWSLTTWPRTTRSDMTERWKHISLLKVPRWARRRTPTRPKGHRKSCHTPHLMRLERTWFIWGFACSYFHVQECNLVCSGIHTHRFLPSSAFFVFCSDHRPRIKEENPGISIGDTAKKLGEFWATQSTKDKAPYVARALKLKEKYEKVTVAWYSCIVPAG